MQPRIRQWLYSARFLATLFLLIMVPMMVLPNVIGWAFHRRLDVGWLALSECLLLAVSHITAGFAVLVLRHLLVEESRRLEAIEALGIQAPTR